MWQTPERGRPLSWVNISALFLLCKCSSHTLYFQFMFINNWGNTNDQPLDNQSQLFSIYQKEWETVCRQLFWFWYIKHFISKGRCQLNKNIHCKSCSKDLNWHSWQFIFIYTAAFRQWVSKSVTFCLSPYTQDICPITSLPIVLDNQDKKS